MDLLDRVTETGASAPALWPLEAPSGLLVTERGSASMALDARG
jgi:hypothetical protein